MRGECLGVTVEGLERCLCGGVKDVKVLFSAFVSRGNAEGDAVRERERERKGEGERERGRERKEREREQSVEQSVLSSSAASGLGDGLALWWGSGCVEAQGWLCVGAQGPLVGFRVSRFRFDV